MKSITRIIIGLAGIAAIGLLTYYVVSQNKNTNGGELPIAPVDLDTVANATPITNPDLDTVAIAEVVQDAQFEKIKKELNIDGEDFTLTDKEGIYTNSSKTKMLIIKENIWKRMLRKVQDKLPNLAEDCKNAYEKPNLADYAFVGLLTYYTDGISEATTAYDAIEIRNGSATYFAGGAICCECEGEPLTPQQVDAVILK